MSRTEGKKRKKKDPTDWPEVANKEREIITAPTGHNELFYLELKWVHVICPLTFDLYNRPNQTVTDTESTFYTKFPFRVSRQKRVNKLKKE